MAFSPSGGYQHKYADIASLLKRDIVPIMSARNQTRSVDSLCPWILHARCPLRGEFAGFHTPPVTSEVMALHNVPTITQRGNFKGACPFFFSVSGYFSSLQPAPRRSLSQTGHPRYLVCDSVLPLLSFFSVTVLSDLKNITVDDHYGDPVTGQFPYYQPDNIWIVGSPNESCGGCHVNPQVLDVNQIYNQTWHDTTPMNSPIPRTVTVQFTGSAVYVFNIVPNTLPRNTITFTNITFSVDDISPYTFIHHPDSTSTILYHQLIYQNTALDHGLHTLTMTGGPYSLILFDYLIYTTQSNDTTSTLAETPSTSANAREPSQSSSASNTPTPTPPSSSPHTPIGAIAGGAVGGVILLSGVALGAFVLGRMRTRRSASSPAHPPQARADGDPNTALLSTAHPVTLWVYGAEAHGVSREVRLRPSSVVAVADGTSDSTELTPRRRRELTRRLEALQRTRSVLSSQPATDHSRSELSGGVETVLAMRELEIQISQLRNVLADWNDWRLADGDHPEHLEPLPQYAE